MWRLCVAVLLGSKQMKGIYLVYPLATFLSAPPDRNFIFKVFHIFAGQLVWSDPSGPTFEINGHGAYVCCRFIGEQINERNLPNIPYW